METSKPGVRQPDLAARGKRLARVSPVHTWGSVPVRCHIAAELKGLTRKFSGNANTHLPPSPDDRRRPRGPATDLEKEVEPAGRG